MKRSLRVLLPGLLCLASTRFALAQRSAFVLLDSSQAAAAVRQCSRWSPEIEGSWNPTEADIAKLEAGLGTISSLKADSCCIIGASIPHPEKFIRQYVGIIVGRKKLIYVNAFPQTELEPDDSRWRTVPVIVCDGGDYYWGVIFDPLTAKFSQLATNGIA